MRTKLLFIAFFTFSLLIFVPADAHARIGVGVGTGKIQVEDKLKPGVIYELPSLTVLNTGDEAGEYEVEITYHEKQPEHRPPNSWFIFTPKRFHLEPGKVQVVTITLNLPFRMEPGDYFGYLEAHPVKVDEAGSARVGIAAAAKLHFTVVPANLVQSIYYKVLSFWSVYEPWPKYTVITLLVIATLFIMSKFLNINIALKKPTQDAPEKVKDEK